MTTRFLLTRWRSRLPKPPLCSDSRPGIPDPWQDRRFFTNADNGSRVNVLLVLSRPLVSQDWLPVTGTVLGVSPAPGITGAKTDGRSSPSVANPWGLSRAPTAERGAAKWIVAPVVVRVRGPESAHTLVSSASSSPPFAQGKGFRESLSASRSDVAPPAPRIAQDTCPRESQTQKGPREYSREPFPTPRHPDWPTRLQSSGAM